MLFKEFSEFRLRKCVILIPFCISNASEQILCKNDPFQKKGDSFKYLKLPQIVIFGVIFGLIRANLMLKSAILTQILLSNNCHQVFSQNHNCLPLFLSILRTHTQFGVAQWAVWVQLRRKPISKRWELGREGSFLYWEGNRSALEMALGVKLWNRFQHEFPDFIIVLTCTRMFELVQIDIGAQKGGIHKPNGQYEG